ncbi:hypothetical protein L9F63_023568, partial [Diploptera punctata]
IRQPVTMTTNIKKLSPDNFLYQTHNVVNDSLLEPRVQEASLRSASMTSAAPWCATILLFHLDFITVFVTFPMLFTFTTDACATITDFSVSPFLTFLSWKTVMLDI